MRQFLPTLHLLLFLAPRVLSAQLSTPADSSAMPSPCGVLAGRIADTTGRPIAGATIKVLGTRPLRGAVAQSDGSYRVSGIDPGVYEVRVSAVGYNGVREGSVPISAGTAVLNVILRGPTPEDEVVRSDWGHGPTINVGSTMKIQSTCNDDLGRRARPGIYGTPP